MTDLFFPSSPPDAHELRRIMAIRYRPAAITSNFFGVKAYAWPGDTKSTVGKPIRLPGQYYHHLSRFLWRHQVFMELQSRFSDLQLAPTHQPLVQRYMQYMNAMVAGLLTPEQKNTKDPSFRSRLFDLYLVVEYFVGHHEFHLVDSWRACNPDSILECQDVLDLGALNLDMCIAIDSHPYAAQTGAHSMHRRIQRTQSGLAFNTTSWFPKCQLQIGKH